MTFKLPLDIAEYISDHLGEEINGEDLKQHLCKLGYEDYYDPNHELHNYLDYSMLFFFYGGNARYTGTLKPHDKGFKQFMDFYELKAIKESSEKSMKVAIASIIVSVFVGLLSFGTSIINLTTPTEILVPQELQKSISELKDNSAKLYSIETKLGKVVEQVSDLQNSTTRRKQKKKLARKCDLEYAPALRTKSPTPPLGITKNIA